MVKSCTNLIRLNHEVNTHMYFDKFRGQMTVSQLSIHNVGQITLHYHWSPLHKAKTYNSQRRDETQRFFFNSSPGKFDLRVFFFVNHGLIE